MSVLPASARTRARLGVAAVLYMIGCTTAPVEPLPDVHIEIDGSTVDASNLDGGFVDPRIETCESSGTMVGAACADHGDCDDGCFCNGHERCEGAVCFAGSDPCVDAVECTDITCVEESNTCSYELNHEMCSNGLACDGAEECNRAMGCVAGATLYCNDETACTVDSCDDAAGCVFTPRDLDMDGHLSSSCGGDDCEDDPRTGGTIHPGAPEICDNRRDDDCDSLRDYVDPECAATNDTCETATVLPERSGTFSGSTSGLASHYTLACGRGGPDAVFRLRLTAPHDVRVAITGIAPASVSIRNFSSCAAGTDLRCSPSEIAPSILARSLPVGEYAIIVTSSRGGAFDLNLTISDPTSAPAVDTCGPGTEEIRTSGTFVGRFDETRDDYRLPCNAPGTWRDAAYRLVLTAPSDVVLSASTTGEDLLNTHVALLTSCTDVTSIIGCTNSEEPTVIRRLGLPAGTYYVLIETSEPTASEWTLTATITTPAAPRLPADGCTSELPITLTGTGDTQSGLGNATITASYAVDGGTTCGGVTEAYHDVFFSFTLPNMRDVTITTNGDGDQFHFVGLQRACGVIGSELRCGSGVAPVAQSWRSLPAGTYHIVLSTWTLTTVTALVETRPPTPIPPNDRCAGAITLRNGDSVRHTITDFDDDLESCVDDEDRPDAFYTFTLPTPRRVIVSVSPVAPSTGQLFLALRNNCAAEATVTGGCRNSIGGDAATINTTTALPAGTYSLMVEMNAGATSAFTLDFVTLPP